MPLRFLSGWITLIAVAATSHAALSPVEEKIVAAVRAQSGDFARDLEQAVQIDSATENLAGVRKMADVFNAQLSALGLDTKFMADALLPMINGRQHPLEKKIIPQILTRHFNTGMSMGFISKDLKIAVDTAQAIGAHAPLAGLTHALWAQAVAQFGGQLDQTAVARLWETASGVTLDVDAQRES